jgi:hypothetical protein
MDNEMSTQPTTSKWAPAFQNAEARFLHDWRHQGLTQAKAKTLIASFTRRYLEDRPMHIYSTVLDSIKVIELMCGALNSGTLPQGKGGDDETSA